MNARMAKHNDVDKLIKVRFDYFATEKWELTGFSTLHPKK